ncbi:MAG TPA: hypothetical protein VF310_00865, partial [Vicinamibacteria bacterium]
PSGEDSVRRLESFVAQVAAARRHLAGFFPAAESEADSLAEQTGHVEARLELAAQTVGSMTQSVETHHQHALSELGSLALAGLQLNEQAVGAARSHLENLEAGLGRGVQHARDDMNRLVNELAQISGQAGSAAAELEEEQNQHGHGLEESHQSLRLGVIEAGEKTNSAGTESVGALEASRHYVNEGLEPHLGSTFHGFLGELSERLQPALADGLGEVGRTVLRSFDELDALVESATSRLADETEPVLRDLAGLLEDWTRDMGRRIDGSAQHALRPYDAEVERHLDANRKGHEIASEVAQLVPHLATARQVADRIQELLDVMNPFG